jgi:copper chaperone
MTTRTLSVPDISCEHCERAIKGALEPLAGVKAVQVGIDEIKQAVEDEEYPVAAVQ